MKKYFVILGIALAAGLVLAALGTFSLGATAQQDQAGNESPGFLYKLNKKYDGDYKDGVLKVRAGTGGAISPLTWFFPRNADIKVGETVVWYNPTSVAEPHTVTFIMDNSAFADFAAPFIVENQTSFSPAIPNSNAEPIVMPGPEGKNIIVALNNRSFMPTVIDSAGNATYLPSNANYTVTGTEKYINSGWIWPKGQSPPGLPPIDSFSVTFSKEGTYNYLCAVHPWMTGQVNVTE